jgi:hypothetical protein
VLIFYSTCPPSWWEKRWISNSGIASSILRLHNIGPLQFVSDIDVYFKLSRTLIVLCVLLLLQKSCWSWSSTRSLKEQFIITELVNYHVRWIDRQDMSKMWKLDVKTRKTNRQFGNILIYFDTSVNSGKNVLWIYITFIWIFMLVAKK